MTAPTRCHSENDLRQASGKGWETAERMVKAVAEERGWPHGSRHDLYRAVGRLAKEVPEDAVEQALDEVEEFAGRLADLIA